MIPKTRSVSFYYENIWKQMVKSSGCRLERKFPVHDFLLDIEKMNKEFSYEFLDKILKYVLRNREHGILRKNDFQFMDRFAGKRDSLEQQTESRSAIRCLKEDLIGMEQVKEQVMETVQVMKFNRLPKEMGLKKSSYHNVHMMLGAPGSSLVKIIEKTLYRIWGNHFLRGRYMIIPAVNDPGQFRHCNRRMQLQ